MKTFSAVPIYRSFLPVQKNDRLTGISDEHNIGYDWRPKSIKRAAKQPLFYFYVLLHTARSNQQQAHQSNF